MHCKLKATLFFHTVFFFFHITKQILAHSGKFRKYPLNQEEDTIIIPLAGDITVTHSCLFWLHFIMRLNFLTNFSWNYKSPFYHTCNLQFMEIKNIFYIVSSPAVDISNF